MSILNAPLCLLERLRLDWLALNYTAIFASCNYPKIKNLNEPLTKGREMKKVRILLLITIAILSLTGINASAQECPPIYTSPGNQMAIISGTRFQEQGLKTLSEHFYNSLKINTLHDAIKGYSGFFIA